MCVCVHEKEQAGQKNKENTRGRESKIIIFGFCVHEKGGGGGGITKCKKKDGGVLTAGASSGARFSKEHHLLFKKV